MVALTALDDVLGEPAACGLSLDGSRIALAAQRPSRISARILLLDEPFAARDKNLRLDMQIEVKRLQRRAGITTILVTHDYRCETGKARE